MISGAQGPEVTLLAKFANATVSKRKDHCLCDLNLSLYMRNSGCAQHSIAVIRSTSTRYARVRGSMTSDAGPTAY